MLVLWIFVCVSIILFSVSYILCISQQMLTSIRCHLLPFCTEGRLRVFNWTMAVTLEFRIQPCSLDSFPFGDAERVSEWGFCEPGSHLLFRQSEKDISSWCQRFRWIFNTCPFEIRPKILINYDCTLKQNGLYRLYRGNAFLSPVTHSLE